MHNLVEIVSGKTLPPLPQATRPRVTDQSKEKESNNSFRNIENLNTVLDYLKKHMLDNFPSVTAAGSLIRFIITSFFILINLLRNYKEGKETNFVFI